MTRNFIAYVAISLMGLAPAFSSDNFSLFGQELGVSTYAEARKDLASKATLSEGETSSVSDGRVLKAVLKKGLRTEIILSYDSKNHLAAIVVQGDQKQVDAIFASLTKGLKETSGVYINGNGIAEMERRELPSFLAVTTAYKEAMGKVRAPALMPFSMSMVWAISIIVGVCVWFAIVRLQERIWHTQSGGWTKGGLLRLAMSIDLPGYDKIMPLTQRLCRVSTLLVPLASTFCWYVLMVFTNTDVKAIAIAVPVLLLGSILLPAICELSQAMGRHSSNLLYAFAVIGLIAGVALGLTLHVSLLFIIGYALAGAAIAGIGGILAGLAGGIALHVASLVAIAGYPISWPILKIMVVMINSRMRKYQWIVPGGKPIIVVNTCGLSCVNAEAGKVYVSDPCLRRNGKAENFGIPKFTLQEFCDKRVVNAALAKSAMTLAKLAEADEQFNAAEFKWFALSATDAGLMEIMIINPATGLSTIDNIAGSIDVGGNMWGHDTNPATELQTIGGTGSDDIGGNSYGFDHNINNNGM